eukprot:191331_1
MHMLFQLALVLYSITWKAHSITTWNCDTEASCLSETFVCSSGDECNLQCSDKYSCHFGVLVCGLNSICNIQCNANTHNELNAIGGYQCSDMIIDATAAAFLSITINGVNFERSVVYCPVNGNNGACNIHYDQEIVLNSVTFHYNFNNSQFYAINGFGSDLLFIGEASTWDSYSGIANLYFGTAYKDACLIFKNTTRNRLICELTTTPSPTNPPILSLDVDWYCNGTASCMSSSFTCNTYDICRLTCYGQYSCHFATLECGINSICYVECGSDALDNSCSDMIIDAR